MLCQLLLLQFAAHLLADFVFQPENWSDKKISFGIAVITGILINLV